MLRSLCWPLDACLPSLFHGYDLYMVLDYSSGSPAGMNTHSMNVFISLSLSLPAAWRVNCYYWVPCTQVMDDFYSGGKIWWWTTKDSVALANPRIPYQNQHYPINNSIRRTRIYYKILWHVLTTEGRRRRRASSIQSKNGSKNLWSHWMWFLDLREWCVFVVQFSTVLFHQREHQLEEFLKPAGASSFIVQQEE